MKLSQTVDEQAIMQDIFWCILYT